MSDEAEAIGMVGKYLAEDVADAIDDISSAIDQHAFISVAAQEFFRRIESGADPKQTAKAVLQDIGFFIEEWNNSGEVGKT